MGRVVTNQIVVVEFLNPDIQSLPGSDGWSNNFSVYERTLIVQNIGLDCNGISINPSSAPVVQGACVQSSRVAVYQAPVRQRPACRNAGVFRTDFRIPGGVGDVLCSNLHTSSREKLALVDDITLRRKGRRATCLQGRSSAMNIILGKRHMQVAVAQYLPIPTESCAIDVDCTICNQCASSVDDIQRAGRRARRGLGVAHIQRRTGADHPLRVVHGLAGNKINIRSSKNASRLVVQSVDNYCHLVGLNAKRLGWIGRTRCLIAYPVRLQRRRIARINQALGVVDCPVCCQNLQILFGLDGATSACNLQGATGLSQDAQISTAVEAAFGIVIQSTRLQGQCIPRTDVARFVVDDASPRIHSIVGEDPCAGSRISVDESLPMGVDTDGCGTLNEPRLV